MNTPRVLDAQGRELAKGDNVERAFLVSGLTGGMVGEVDRLDRDGTVWVLWQPSLRVTRPVPSVGSRWSPAPLALDFFRRTFRCPDLLLVQKGPTE